MSPVRMASAMIVDVIKEKEQNKDLVSEEDGDAQDSLTSKQAESSHDSYDSGSENDSDFAESDCSVTSGLHGHPAEEIGFFLDIPAGFSTADESGETTWTDEKHSSYLDSMEANFVQKMYDKEYCSLDVCGHSSRSSLSLDQDSVESHPLYINMRKPCDTKVARLITFKGPTRSLPMVPSMFASPWIQHFKSQRNPSIQTGLVHDKSAQLLRGDIPTKDVLKTAATNHATNSSIKDSCQSDHGSTSKKHDIGSAMQGVDYKRQKCQLFALSQLDILMEQQYDLEQRRKLEYQKHSDVGSERSADSLANHHKCSKEIFLSETVAPLESDVFKEDLHLSTEIKPIPFFGNEMCARKLDQVVPSFQSVGENAGEKAESGGSHGDEEGCCTATSEAACEAQCVTTRSGSKTWTWGIQGPRYHAVKQTSADAFPS